MDNNQTASLFHVRLQRELGGIRPRSSAPAKVGNDHIVLSEVWNKIRSGLGFLECLSRSFQGDRPLRDQVIFLPGEDSALHIHRKQFRLLQIKFHHDRRF